MKITVRYDLESNSIIVTRKSVRPRAPAFDDLELSIRRIGLAISNGIRIAITSFMRKTAAIKVDTTERNFHSRNVISYLLSVGLELVLSHTKKYFNCYLNILFI